MRILFTGYLDEGQTCRMRMEALRAIGHEVTGVNMQAMWRGVSFASRQLQSRLERGPAIDRYNAEVLAAARATRPELFWAEKQELLRASTLEAVKALGVRMLHYTPDPYFSLWWKRTRTMDAAIGLFDVLVTSKQYEMAAYAEVGPQVIYVPLGFGLDAHRPMSPADAVPRAAFASDVGFLGGWEPRREQLLSAVAPHVPSLKIWGNAWDHLHDGRWTLRRYYRLKTNAGTAKFSIRRNAPIAAALQGNEVYAHEYAWALSGAKISVGFLRHVCPDQHTTRSFEIPACGSLMIADRTDEHREFFEEGKEAEFFSSTDELVDKVRFYVANDAARERMAKAGFERCHSAGYSYHHRVAEILRKCR